MRKRLVWLTILTLLLGLLTTWATSVVIAQVTIYSTQSGDWKDTATWDGGVVPVTGDTAVIADGHTVLMNDNNTIYKILTNATSELQFSGAETFGGTIAWTVTLSFDDTAGSGWDSSSAGQNTFVGSTTYGVTVTTANGAPPPTNRWNQQVGATKNDIENASFTYFEDYSGVDDDIDPDNPYAHIQVFTYSEYDWWGGRLCISVWFVQSDGAGTPTLLRRFVAVTIDGEKLGGDDFIEFEDEKECLSMPWNIMDSSDHNVTIFGYVTTDWNGFIQSYRSDAEYLSINNTPRWLAIVLITAGILITIAIVGLGKMNKLVKKRKVRR